MYHVEGVVGETKRSRSLGDSGMRRRLPLVATPAVVRERGVCMRRVVGEG